MSHEERPSDLKGLEAALAALVPRERLDRDRLMFAAGLAAARPPRGGRGRWAWPALSAVVAAAATLLAAVVLRPAPEVRVVDRVIEAPPERGRPAETPPKLAAADAPKSPLPTRETPVGPIARLRWAEASPQREGDNGELLDRVLSADGVHAAGVSGEASPAPVSYGDWMRDFRDESEAPRAGGRGRLRPGSSGARS